MYEATWDSVRTHRVPDWYEDAKLGVFLHWGLYSVPGWAPQVPDIQELLVHSGPRTMLRENPYAEWYRNTMLIRGSPTEGHHRRVYGDDYPYDNFVRVFDEASARANLDGIAELCQAAGARYAVLTTKHHEGFALWPTTVPHPVKGDYHAARDLVGGLTTAVRARGLRMGLYYSGGYDWPYNGAVLKRAGHAVLAVPNDRRYVGVRHRPRAASSSISTGPLCSGTTLRGRPPATCPSSSPTTTTPSPTAWSTTAGPKPRCRGTFWPTGS